MSSLAYRVISAVAAVGLLITLYVLWGTYGLFAITTVIIGLASYELSTMLFQSSTAKGRLFQPLFVISNLLSFLSLSLFPDRGLALYGTLIMLYTAALIFHLKNQQQAERTLHEICYSLCGITYIGFFTHFAGRLILHDDGALWFAFLLAVPLSGDTFAYFVGKSFGRRKILPSVSPKKTVEGAIGGLLGSMIAASLLHFFIDTPIWILAGYGLFAGALAQCGDFFESLIKRAALVKDSGSIMPGHGGVLDRIDGIIFNCPLFFALVQFITL